MRKFFLNTLFLTLTTLSFGAVKTPIDNGKIINTVDGNAQVIEALGKLGLGSSTGNPATARVHILPAGSPTAAVDGIKIANDVAIFRSGTGTLTIDAANVTITGSLSFNGSGFAALASNNTFAGTVNFNGPVNLNTTTTVGNSGLSFSSTGRTVTNTNLHLTVGTYTQAWSASLDTLAGLTPTSGNMIAGNGTAFYSSTPSQTRTALGLNTGDSPAFTGLTLSGSGTVNGSLLLPNASSTSTYLGLNGLKIYATSSSLLTIAGSTTVTGNTNSFGNASNATHTFAGKLVLSSDGSVSDTFLYRNASNTLKTDGVFIANSLTVTNPVTIANGGTGLASFTTNSVVYTSNTGTLSFSSLTPFGRSILAAADGVAVDTLLGLGTAALKTVPTVGVNATSTQVVMGDDTRLVVQPNSIALGTATTGNYVATITAGASVTVTGSGAETAAVTIDTIQPLHTTASPTFSTLSLAALAVGGNSAFGGTITVTGNSTLSGSVSIGTNLGVTGNSTLSGSVSIGTNLSVTGTTTLATALPVTSGGTGATTAAAARVNLGIVALVPASTTASTTSTLLSDFTTYTLLNTTAQTFTLPSNTALGDGFEMTLKQGVSLNELAATTIACSGADTIDGIVLLKMNQRNESYTFRKVSNTVWKVVSHYSPTAGYVYKNVSSAYTVLASDSILDVFTSASTAGTVTLPTIDTSMLGKVYYIKYLVEDMTDATTRFPVTVSGTQNIDNAATFVLKPEQYLTVVATRKNDGSAFKWKVLAHNPSKYIKSKAYATTGVTVAWQDLIDNGTLIINPTDAGTAFDLTLPGITSTAMDGAVIDVVFLTSGATSRTFTIKDGTTSAVITTGSNTTTWTATGDVQAGVSVRLMLYNTGVWTIIRK